MIIDVATIQKYIELFRILIAIISTTILTIVAVLGLRTWKTQLKGKTEYELARRLLRSIYKVRDAISIVRNPFASSAEISISLDEADIDIEPNEPDFHQKSQAALYQRRWNKVTDAMSEFDLEAFEAEVIWGDEITGKLDNFRKLVGSLHFHIQMYLRNLNKPFRDDYGAKMLNKVDDVIYDFHNLKNTDDEEGNIEGDDGSEDLKINEFTQDILSTISEIEGYLRNKMEI